MAGLIKTFYNVLITSLVGKIKDYGSAVNFDKDLPRTAAFNVTVPDASVTVKRTKDQAEWQLKRYPTYYTGLNITELDQSEAPTAELLNLNKVSYLGLLVDAPVYYSGGTTISISGTTYNNLYPEKYFKTDPTTPVTFLEVHEIPKDDLGYFTDVDDSSYVPNPNKLFNGGCWSSYNRLCLYKRLPDLSLRKESSSHTSTETEVTLTTDTYYTEDAGSGSATDTLTYFDTCVLNDSGTDYEPQVYLNNQASLYLGENTNTYPWPAVKYFGLYNTQAYSAKLRFEAARTGQTEDTVHIFDEALYYWGELTENNKWYHATTDTSPQTGKTYYTYDIATATYIIFTGSTFESGVTYYEKTGVIVQPGQGGVFSKEKFKIKWDSEIITNSLPTFT